ncbi:histone deacetylase 8-like isoform X1 [Euwallacea similis]|uniref:histone deacetylase 8-like isoform X1 n=1 Tax=Euwallacea similis TaxID=1736056 RepID=UPI00344DC8B4
MSKNQIAYIYSDELKAECDKVLFMQNRASIVHNLICSYQLLSSPNIFIVANRKATEEELKAFHSSSYVDFLKAQNSFDLNLDEINDDHLEYGLAYDCPPFKTIFDFCLNVAGGSLSAAKVLASKKVQVAINWFGGWHHALRDSAVGFCYINDVVLAIQFLSKHFQKILYIDLDIHHGDGVQYAFEYSNRILTLSFHRYEIGFFPGTGTIEDVGKGKGKFYSLNVPFKSGLNDNSFTRVFKQLFPVVLDSFKPNAIVLQCGADGLNGDHVGECNLTLKGLGNCVKSVLNCNLPTLLLGGGGYNAPNTARLWTYITAIALNRDVDNDIPDSFEYFSRFGPSYELNIEAGRKSDLNNDEYLNSVVETLKSYCGNVAANK